jgi:hypothetical protein
VGDRLDIPAATIANYYGQIQLTGAGPAGAPGGVSVRSSGNALPPAVPANPADLQADLGGLSTRLEGVLVRIDGVTVTDIAPTPGPGDTAPTNEFAVTGDLRVNDYLYLVDPFPVLGEQYQSIAGVLEYRNSAFKIEPRSAADVFSGPPALVAMEPPLAFVREGSTGAIPTPLTVRLSSAPPTDVVVTATSASPKVDVANGGQVTIPAGSLSAVVPVIGVAGTDGATVTLTAALGGATRTSAVRVLNASDVPHLVSLTPANVTTGAGATVHFTVQLDLPAATATGVALSVAPAGLGTTPATVVIPADQLSASFDLQVGAGATGSGTVTTSAGPDQLTSNVTVVTVPPTNHLVISELSPRGLTAFDEFVELYNPTSQPVDLSGWTLQTKSATATIWTDRVVFPATTTVASHGYLLTANTNGYDSAGGSGPVPDFSWLVPTTGIGDSGAAIRLIDQAGGIVDAVAYGGSSTQGEGTPLPAHPGSGAPTRSFERKARASSTEATMNGSGSDALAGNGVDTGDNSTDFYLRATTDRDPQNSASPHEP